MSNISVGKKSYVKGEIINVAIVAALLLTLCLVVPLATQNVTNTWYKANNQYILGPVVNAALIYAALRFKKVYNVIGVVLLPSISVAILGAIGINAVFMMYMIPFIWLGNMTIFISFRYLFRNIKNSSARYAITAIIGIGLKVAIIFVGFVVLRSCGVFPTPIAQKLYVMMGVVQLITATCGAVVAFGVIKCLSLKSKKIKA